MEVRFYKILSFVVIAFLCVSCVKGESEQKGIFVIKNLSNHNLDIYVFNTSNAKLNPLKISIPNNGIVERVSYGGSGNISYPELFSQGDSIVILFDNGKKLVHYCAQPQQVDKQCSPAKNLLLLSQYSVENVDDKSTRFTFIITSSDFNLAQ